MADDGSSSGGNGAVVVANRVIRRRVEPCPRLRSERPQLPVELIEGILGNLKEMADRVKFSAVCKRWHSSLRSAFLPRVRLPWILLLPRVDKTIQFHSISTDKTFSVHHNLDHGLMDCELGTSDSGWLLVADFDNRDTPLPLLFNPITGAQIPLPKLPDNIFSFPYNISVSPGDESRVVMLTFSANIRLFCYRLLEAVEKPAEWTVISIKDLLGDGERTNTFTYHRGQYFIVGSRWGSTCVVDAHTNKLVSVIPPPHGMFNEFRRLPGRIPYLVQSTTGDKLFLLVSCSIDGSKIFDVFLWDSTEQQNIWSKVTNIGSDTFFKSDFGVMALPAANNSSTSIRANCIVFLDDQNSKSERLCLFDIENDSIEQLPCSCKWQPNTWSLHWFLPVL